MSSLFFFALLWVKNPQRSDTQFLTIFFFIMARILLGSIITSIAGSIGGTTFRRSANGLVMQNKQQVQKRSARSSNSRISQIASIIKLWNGFDNATVTAWNNAALLYEFKNKFGQPVYYTGRQLLS